MSIKTRLSLIVLGVIALLAGVQVLVLREAVSPGFRELELELAARDLYRPVNAIDNEVGHLTLFARDWASSDEMWSFVRGENPAHAEANLYHTVLAENDLVLIYVVDTSGKVVWSDEVAPEGFEDVTLASFPPGLCPPDHPLLIDPELPSPRAGVMLTEWGPMIVSAQPVLRNGRARPCVGTMVVARALDEDLIQHLQVQTHVDFKLVPVGGEELDPQLSGYLSRLKTGEREIFEPQDAEEMRCLTLIRDVRNRPALVVQAQVQRDVTMKGRQALDLALMLSLGGAACVVLVLHRLLHRGVVLPLVDLTSKVVDIGVSRSAGKELVLVRADEIGVLSRRFATMLADLQEYQRRAVDSSHRAGMAEIATNVLHNVGNMLNSVTVASSVVREKVGLMPIDDLAAVAGRMQGLGDQWTRWVSEDPGGRQLPAYLELVSGRLSEARAKALEECSELSGRVSEIAAVIQDQQRIAKAGGHVEALDLADQVDAALRITMPRSKGIEVRRGAWERVHVHGDRYKLLQILVNLVQNAIEAYQGLEREDPWIELSVTTRGGHPVVEVRDNACGLPAELIERVFQHGFTTKPEGHGFGLHSAATAALELQGQLSASSPGPGLGATFTLEFKKSAELPAERELRRAS